MAFPIIGAIAAGAQLLGGLAGQNAKKNAARDLDRLGKERAALFGAIDTPDIEDQELALEQLALMGELDPEMLQALDLGPTAMEDVAVDPRLVETQMDALAQLAQLSEGGLTEADLAAIEQTRRSVDAAENARQESILQEMQQRGQGGAGAELAARLASSQGAADRQNQASLDISQQAQNRALQALAEGANLAGSVRGQEFGEQSDIARARDLINQFNVSNRQNVANQNVGARNQAQAANLAARQAIADQNVALRNQQQMYNKQLLQQEFDNRMRRAQGMAGGSQLQAQGAQVRGATDSQTQAGIGSVAGNLIGSIFGGK